MTKESKPQALSASSATRAERDAYWLEHFRAIESEGIQIKAYAQREGLAVQAVYQAKKRLVERGVMPRRRSARRFVRVRVVDDPPRGGGCRLRVGPSAVVEWEEAPSVEVLGALLKQVVTLR